MSDQDRMRKAADRYEAAAHAVQTGIMLYQQTKPETQKNLRVGITTAQTDQAALAKLLIAKGVFTQVEYHEAMAEAMEEEIQRWQAWVEKVTGAKVTLR